MFSKAGLTKHIFYTTDKFRVWSNFMGLVINISKDVHKTCFLALIKFYNGSFSYILAADGLLPGMFIRTILRPQRLSLGYKIGYAVILKYLLPNDIFFNIEILPNKGSIYAKSAGTFCNLLNNDFTRDLSLITLPTGEKIKISFYCFVSLGRASNIQHFKTVIGRAGINRLYGKKPSVRGVAMNPVDHPHGGRTKSNSPELTPWNKIAKNSH